MAVTEKERIFDTMLPSVGLQYYWTALLWSGQEERAWVREVADAGHRIAQLL
jgi:hypothetical protein